MKKLATTAATHRHRRPHCLALYRIRVQRTSATVTLISVTIAYSDSSFGPKKVFLLLKIIRNYDNRLQ